MSIGGGHYDEARVRDFTNGEYQSQRLFIVIKVRVFN